MPRPELHRLDAPFGPEHVWALNRFQCSGINPPFTCSKGHVLVARTSGWFCPRCGYEQDWAWKEMLVDPCGNVAGHA
jgi:hypothetical protein